MKNETTPLKVLEKPYTQQEMQEHMSDICYVTGNVAVPLSEIIQRDFESFLDLLAIKLVDNECLMDINYKAVGIRNMEFGDAEIIMEVSGNVSEIIEMADIETFPGKGYAIADFDSTGLLEIQRIGELDIFETDDEAVEQAIKDGVKIIPIEELPENFERRYLGWIDTPENRKAIEAYCKKGDSLKRCPKCGGDKFIVTYHVTQSVAVDGNGNFIREVSSCDEITHAADDDDIWVCDKCGYNAAGRDFNKERDKHV